MTDPQNPVPAPSAGLQPLIVPMRVEALTVNERVRQAEAFQRWQANYALTRLHLSPEPPPFSNTDLDFNADPGREGVYLHWQLPEALTAGVDEAPDGEGNEDGGGPVFPLVPNRWLVVRQAVATVSGARTESGWVVESDYLDAARGTSTYLDRDGNLTRIGRRINLATGAWTEPGTPAGGLFLTAVGPGLPTFAAYQPYNTDVFSLHDRPDDLDPTLEWRLNYLVAGWYSDPAGDPLAGGLETRLAAMNWAASGTAPISARTLCHGTVLDVRWQRLGGGMPLSGRPDYLTIAVGNTTDHARETLEEHAARRAGEPPQLAALLAAVQSGVLDLLDETDGEFNAERARHASWFTPTPAGYSWVLEEAEPQDDNSRAPRAKRRRTRAARSAHAAALARLNTDQAAHDEAVRELLAAQRRLYDLWWAANLPKVPDDPCEPERDYREELNALVRNATEETADRRDAVRQARDAIPWGDNPEDLDDAIRDYQVEHDLPADEVVLKRAVLSDFQLPNDPVIVIRGTKDRPQPPTPQDADPYAVPPGRYAADDEDEDEDPPLTCRWPDQLVTGLTVSGTAVSATEAQTPKPPNLPTPDGLSGTLAALLRELFHLASSNAPKLASLTGYTGQVQALVEAMRAPHANAIGTPGAYTAQWQQPWSPLFFEWKVDYFPIEWHGEPDGSAQDQANWHFDGDRYHWLGTGAHPVPVTLRGRQFLTPTPGQTAAAALRQYASTHPGPAASALRALARQAEQADWFSQQLVGFTEQLTARGHTPAVINPHEDLDPALRTALAEAAGRTLPPSPGPRPRPFTGWNASFYQPLRAGQFAFERLAVIDRFGHALPAIYPDPRALDFDDDEPGDVIGIGTPARRFAPELPEELAPSPVDPTDETKGVHAIHPPTWYRFTQLTPRLLQPARAQFTLLDALDLDDRTPLDQAPDPDATAVAAWLVPAHLDQALHCYAPDGAPLGELRTTLPPSGTPQVTWHPLPYSGYAELGDLHDGFRHLHDFLTELCDPDRGPAAMRALLAVIDRTLSMTAPTGGTPPPDTPSVLLGRPLALLRARLQLDLDGPPYADPSWQNLREPAAPPYPDYRWPIRLGERNELADGLVGYFHGTRGTTDYTLLHTVLDEPELPEGEGRGYFHPIGTGTGLTLPARPPGSDPEDRQAAFLTLLADPRGTVHATTDILPTAEVRLPTRLVEPPLAALPVSFRLGPLPLTAHFPDPEETRDGQAPALTLPRPSDRHGTWTWAERDAVAWSYADTRPADGQARHPHPVPALRTGRLQLRPARDDETEGTRR
ncbi:hypothetical protein [Streptomyces sioyaensis]|uniref:hypothetical protein n=1 Tax=Streptomyces sioyaensis TaxID=67364 RepID=UPI0037BC8B17